MSSGGDMRCSFCDRAPDDVAQMIARSRLSQKVADDRYIASHSVAICDECVRLCVEVLEEGKPPET